MKKQESSKLIKFSFAFYKQSSLMNNDGSYITSEKSGLQNTQLYKQEYYIILKEFCEHDIDG